MSIVDYLDESEIEYKFVHSSGPGGQNVNKVATAVQLRFNLKAATLPDAIKEKLLEKLGNRLTKEGEILIESRGTRSQLRNKELAFKRLIKLLEAALISQKKRIPTRPSLASKQKRLEQKKKRGEIKKSRQPIKSDS